jgi:uncharacterized RDD family membrane protein YckC
MSELRLQTPEGVSFSFSLASPVTRLLAVFIDMAVTTAISIALSIVIRLLLIFSMDAGTAISVLSYFVVSIWYGIIMEYSWRGQTLGKRVLRLRVVDAGGLRLTLSQVVIRNLLRAVDMMPVGYLLGGMVSLISPRYQRLGDLAANTVVIRIPSYNEPDLSKIDLPKFNSLRSYPHLVARLRQRISPVEAGVLLDAVLRRDEFEPLARVRLFQELGEHCRNAVLFPAEAVEAITDEQYVRNVLDVLYEKAR